MKGIVTGYTVQTAYGVVLGARVTFDVVLSDLVGIELKMLRSAFEDQKMREITVGDPE
jgi:hypothetical protein